MKIRYDLSIRYVRPWPLAVQITGERLDGMTDGFHTGGAWEYEGLIYKPLDGRPYANCEFHFETDELDVLTEMAGQPLFPKNWTVECRNGRNFLVRKKAIILGKDMYILSRKNVLYIEQAIRNLNEHGWEINDLISIGFDADTDELFVVDMSAAQKMRTDDPPSAWSADDSSRITKFFEIYGFSDIKALRQAAQHEYFNAIMEDGHPAFDMYNKAKRFHVYASFNRPISLLWATKLKEYQVVLKHQLMDVSNGIPLTWIFSPIEISEEILYDYELVWGWSPLHKRG